MKELIQNFTTQLRESLAIGQKYQFISTKNEFNNIVLTGLGGSGIGGSIVQNFCFDKLSVPFIVNKDYFLPSFVNSKSLVIISSYSGNTEETIATMKQAIAAGATVIGVTSGGKVAEIAKENNLDCIMLPGGMPPRSCIGYSMLQVLCILAHYGFINNGYVHDVEAAIQLLDTNEEDIYKQAQAIAGQLLGKLPIIYAAGDFEGVAVRIRQQLNENSKMLGWINVIPEMNHNELVGWRDVDNNKAVIILRNENDYERVKMRMDINKTVFEQYTSNIIELHSKGNSYWEKVFYFIHLTDWVSLILADLRGVDVTEVKVIDHLKAALSKH